MTFEAASSLVAIAFGVPDDRVLGGPKWIDSERFDIEARAAAPGEGPGAARGTLPVCLRSLFEDGSGLRSSGRAKGGLGRIAAQRITRARFEGMSRMLASPVIDRADAAGEPAGRAVGLELHSRKLAVETIVIDRAERPSEN